MPEKAATRAEAARLQAFFEARGADLVSLDIMQPADTLLDLYGEDIRARAYVTNDPVRGELMLRPDFTVPVVEMHMREGAEPARYTYAGKVFRQQDAGAARAHEYMQVGYEVFDREDPVSADAEVFALFVEALAAYDTGVVTGDIGLLIAAVQGLSTSKRRRAALLRHIWRPNRFRALLERFSTPELPEERKELLDALAKRSVPELVQAAGPEIGVRSIEEVAARLLALQEDAQVDPIPEAERQAILDLLSLAVPLPDAIDALCRIADSYSAISEAVGYFERRAAQFERAGDIGFEGSFGRTMMEYYDGFVFGFSMAGQGLPVATGGRYDALTRVLGQGRSIPAVGGVIRPDLLIREGRA